MEYLLSTLAAVPSSQANFPARITFIFHLYGQSSWQMMQYNLWLCAVAEANYVLFVVLPTSEPESSLVVHNMDFQFCRLTSVIAMHDAKRQVITEWQSMKKVTSTPLSDDVDLKGPAECAKRSAAHLGTAC